MIEQVIDRLAAAYPDLSRDEVFHCVHTAYDRFQDSTVREFVPLLVERRARAELSRHAGALVWSS
ncbi:hypothetical protein B1R94_27045 [Mycolicibacterium litorale]|nr:hypothetical protein B1R94_27045 [Mycolicibacterium litorale]